MVPKTLLQYDGSLENSEGLASTMCFLGERGGGEMNTKIKINEALNEINTQVEAWRPREKIDKKNRNK